MREFRLVTLITHFVIVLVMLSIFPTSISALYDPTEVSNNKYGIHILSEADLLDAASLVNSSGGEWGYVKLVIQENDRDIVKWQLIFDRMRTLHLIPIVRIATKPKGSNWEKPRVEDAQMWAQFLGNLNWVVENRYVIIFNEPNHAKEWGGTVSPKEYTQILTAYSQALKAQSPDFFVLNAGLDASAPNSPGVTMDEQTFLESMYEEDDTAFDHIDGFASHSYPNPGFAGSPTGTGQGSVATYLWEKELLKSLGVTRKLPIFITETGWSAKQLSGDQVAENFTTSFTGVWSDPSIVAVVPFILNYNAAPFSEFSWLHSDTPEAKYTPWYLAVQDLPKQAGKPKQLTSAEVVEGLPAKLVQNSTYDFRLVLKNTGQAIWSGSSDASLTANSDGLTVNFTQPDFSIAPGQQLTLPVSISTPLLPASYDLEIKLVGDTPTGAPLYKTSVTIVSALKLSFTAHALFQDDTQGDNFEFLILDGNRQVMQFNSVSMRNGVGNIPEVHNLIPGRQYTFVVKSPDYWPRKKEEVVDVGDNIVQFGYIVPKRLETTYFANIFDYLRRLKLPDDYLFSRLLSLSRRLP